MPPLSEPVQLQLIIVFGSIITAIIGTVGGVMVTMLNRASNRQKQVLEHVQNSHKNPDGTPLNLRDDLDEKFDGLASLVKTAVADIGGLRSDIRDIRKEARVDREQAANDREHLRQVEITLTPAQLDRLRRSKDKR